MSSGSISLSNIQNTIELFNKDLNQCSRSFSNIEDDFIKIKCTNQSLKSDIKDTLNHLHSDLLRNLKKINCPYLEEDSGIETYESHLREFNNVLESFKKNFSDIVTESKVSKEIFLKNYDEITSPKGFSISEDNKFNGPHRVNMHVLNSRQTNHAFNIMVLKNEFKRKCIGCNKFIPTQSLYLSHVEEYPSGSHSYKPHMYHMKRECLFQRGFETKYLSTIQVTCNESIDIDFNNILTEMGFQMKNFILRKSDDSDCDDDDDNKSDSDIPDNASDISVASSAPSTLREKMPSFTFFYHRKPTSQKKVISCQGCQTNIETETYISLERNSKSIPFHIQKNCLKTGGVLLENFSTAKCMVYKLLKTHDELKELLACGFHYNKIIGVRPVNPLSQKPSFKNTQKQNTNDQRREPGFSNSIFIFNEEPFFYERLNYGEKCKGCDSRIQKNDMSLRHKERVPREKTKTSPLTSQYYHASKECLLKRGFTFKYLSFIQCKAILSDDNMSRVTEALINCGFYNENISYSPKQATEERGFEKAQEPYRPVLESKLYIDKCVKSSAHCEGCGFILMPNQPCFIFSTTPEQNGNAKYFHIKSNCLKVQFTKEQIMATTCITNNLVDVNPNDIISCGIVKIVTELVPQNTAKNNPPRNRTRPGVNPPRPKQPMKPSPVLQFYVQIAINPTLLCCVCRQPIPVERYSLRIQNRPPNLAMLHLDQKCVSGFGLSAEQLANSNLVFCEQISHDGLAKLHSCGFRKFPKI